MSESVVRIGIVTAGPALKTLPDGRWAASVELDDETTVWATDALSTYLAQFASKGHAIYIRGRQYEHGIMSYIRAVEVVA